VTVSEDLQFSVKAKSMMQSQKLSNVKLKLKIDFKTFREFEKSLLLVGIFQSK